MTKLRTLLTGLLLLLLWSSPKALAEKAGQESGIQKDSKSDRAAILQALRTQIETMRAEYEKRLKELEDQVVELQAQRLRAAPEPEPMTPAAAPSSVQVTPGPLNPAIGVVGNFYAGATARRS